MPTITHKTKQFLSKYSLFNHLKFTINCLPLKIISNINFSKTARLKTKKIKENFLIDSRMFKDSQQFLAQSNQPAIFSSVLRLLIHQEHLLDKKKPHSNKHIHKILAPQQATPQHLVAMILLKRLKQKFSVRKPLSWQLRSWKIGEKRG